MLEGSTAIPIITADDLKMAEWKFSSREENQNYKEIVLYVHKILRV